MEATAQKIPSPPAKPRIRKSSPRLPDRLPTQEDLPYSDGKPMESQEHFYQMELLMEPIELGEAFQHWYIGGNMFVHFTLDEQVKKVQKKFRGPDVFIVKNAIRKLRLSWVVWQEGKAPEVIIELLSRSTARIDRGIKKELYQNHLKAREYILFDVKKKKLEGYALQQGEYAEIPLDQEGRLVSAELGLALVLWKGKYKKEESTWLRWATLDGVLLLTSHELAAQQTEKAEQERLRAERLAAMLRSLGVDPDE